MYDPEYHQQYYQANKEKKREQGRKWEAANREKVREAQRRRRAKIRAETPELANAAQRKWERENPEKVLLKSARDRAKKYGHGFNLELEDIKIPAYCPLLGIKLEPRQGGHGAKDSSPSLDRIDNTLGYVKGNVWVISWLANKMKATATHEQLLTFAENIQGWLGKKKDK